MTSPLNNLTDTWNNSGTTFYGLKYNITNTASNAASALFDFQQGGTSLCKVIPVGANDAELHLGANANYAFSTASNGNDLYIRGPNGTLYLQQSGTAYASINSVGLQVAGANGINWISGAASSSSGDIFLVRDGAALLAQRNAANAQTLRVYNTYTDASNYERGVFDWTTSSNVLTIDVQVLGSGTQRVISIKHLDSATGGGTATFAATNCPASTLTSPYTWIKVTSSDGSVVYMPAWK